MKTLPFIKMHGLGNDYVFIDCFQKTTEEVIAKIDLPVLARHVSDRHFGIGSDGLVLIMPSMRAVAKMRIFNADGSEAEMCGNAIRCVAKYLYETCSDKKTSLEIETLAGIRSLSLQVLHGAVRHVTVNMGVPQIEKDIFQSHTFAHVFYKVNMGNPHAVFLCDPLPLMPKDTNVEFVKVCNTKKLDVRVIERGSGETMACGTGACASAVAAISQGLTERTVTVHLPGGELVVEWKSDTDPVYMTGSATEVFRGELLLN